MCSLTIECEIRHRDTRRYRNRSLLHRLVSVAIEMGLFIEIRHHVTRRHHTNLHFPSLNHTQPPPPSPHKHTHIRIFRSSCSGSCRSRRRPRPLVGWGGWGRIDLSCMSCCGDRSSSWLLSMAFARSVERVLLV